MRISTCQEMLHASRARSSRGVISMDASREQKFTYRFDQSEKDPIDVSSAVGFEFHVLATSGITKCGRVFHKGPAVLTCAS